MSVCLSLIIFPALTLPRLARYANQPWLLERDFNDAKADRPPTSSTYFCGRLAHLLKVLSHYGGAQGLCH